MLVKRALAAIIPFATVYLCEAGFSRLVTIKTKHRNQLNIEHDMRVALSIQFVNQGKAATAYYGEVFCFVLPSTSAIIKFI